MGYFIFPFWSVMLICWFGLAAFIYKTRLNSLSVKERKYWLILVFAYPVLETILKGSIYFDLIPYSYRPLNLIEHGLWAMSMGLVLYPLLKNSILKLNQIPAFLLVFGVVIVIGNLNELAEFVIRQLMNLTTTQLMDAYYTDTIIDLVVNLIGSGLGAFILTTQKKPDSLGNKEYSKLTIEN